MKTCLLKRPLPSRNKAAKPPNALPKQTSAVLDDAPERPFQPFGAVRKFWSTRQFECLLEGPAGTGKSRGALEKIHYCCQTYKKCRALMVRKTRESMTESTLVTYEQKVVQAGSPVLLGSKRNIRQHYVYPGTDAELIIAGMDKPSKIMSTEFDIIGVFEGTELNENEYEMLTTRLRNGRMGYHQIVVDCNPGHPGHWLNKRANKELMQRFKSKHEDNPVLFDHKLNVWTDYGKWYIATLDRLTGTRKKRLRYGLWTAAEGMVYEGWDDDINVINKRHIPASWRKIRAIDFGFTHPFVCLWIAIDEDGRAYVYRQLYMSQRLVRDHAEVILKWSKGEQYEATVADWDAEGRADLEECGVPTIPAYKAIDRGIENVSMRLRKAADDRPRLMIMRDCLIEEDELLKATNQPIQLLDEVPNYLWKEDQHGLLKRDTPIDRDNHAMDALRYGCAYIDDLEVNTADVQMDTAATVPTPTRPMKFADSDSGILIPSVEIEDSPCTVFVSDEFRREFSY